MTATNYASTAELTLGIVVVAGGLAASTRYARGLAWQPRVAFGVMAGLAIVGALVLAVVVALSPGYVFWPTMVAVLAVIGIVASWRGSSKRVVAMVEVPEPVKDEQPAQRHRPRLAVPPAPRREDPQP